MVSDKKLSPLAVARESRDWSQAQLAHLLGLRSKSYICEIERGKTPSLHVAIGLYRHLGVRTAPIAELTDREISILEKTTKSRANVAGAVHTTGLPPERVAERRKKVRDFVLAVTRSN